MSNLKSLTTENFDKEVSQEDSGTVMVDFWAPWCGPCRKLTPVIENIAEEANGEFKVFSVNVDEQPELAEKFRVRGIPTILVFKNGKLDQTHVGSASKTNLLKMIK